MLGLGALMSVGLGGCGDTEGPLRVPFAGAAPDLSATAVGRTAEGEPTFCGGTIEGIVVRLTGLRPGLAQNITVPKPFAVTVHPPASSCERFGSAEQAEVAIPMASVTVPSITDFPSDEPIHVELIIELDNGGLRPLW